MGMLMSMLMSGLVVVVLSPCVVQQACLARLPRPPSSVCMHRIDNLPPAPENDASYFVMPPYPLKLFHVVDLISPVVSNAIVSACKNCVILGKEEKAMFRAHSDACMSQSGVDPRLVEGLLSGRLEDRPSLRKHVYCVLLKCKLVGKDGKLMKSAVLGKMAMRMDARNASKVLENCSEQASEASSPEDVAWNLFRCGYDRKAVLFDYMPAGNLQQTN